jgi:hypothetical protein
MLPLVLAPASATPAPTGKGAMIRSAVRGMLIGVLLAVTISPSRGSSKMYLGILRCNVHKSTLFLHRYAPPMHPHCDSADVASPALIPKRCCCTLHVVDQETLCTWTSTIRRVCPLWEMLRPQAVTAVFQYATSIIFLVKHAVPVCNVFHLAHVATLRCAASSVDYTITVQVSASAWNDGSQ